MSSNWQKIINEYKEHNEYLIEESKSKNKLISRYRKKLKEISTIEFPGVPIEKHINLLRKIAKEALEDK